MGTCKCNSEDKMMTLEELSDYIKISRSILYKCVREKTLGIPHIKINKAVRFLKSDVDAWVDMCRINTGPEVVSSLNTVEEKKWKSQIK